MNYLNGEEEIIEVNKTSKPDFWELLPEKSNSATIYKIDSRIAMMNKRYRLYTEKNQLLQIIAQLNTLLKNKEDEIAGL